MEISKILLATIVPATLIDFTNSQPFTTYKTKNITNACHRVIPQKTANVMQRV